MGESDLKGGFIDRYSGEQFYPLDPSPEMIQLEDIAQGLANTCRYSGQCRFFYSVGLHSLYVSEELAKYHGPLIQLYGLLHDASEAYLADVPGPVKDGFGNYRKAEKRIQDAVWSAFELGELTEKQKTTVKDADICLLHYEADTLIPTNDWTETQEGMEFDLRADATSNVAERFIDCVRSLLQQIEL